jgi:hypothetical protein
MALGIAPGKGDSRAWQKRLSSYDHDKDARDAHEASSRSHPVAMDGGVKPGIGLTACQSNMSCG